MDPNGVRPRQARARSSSGHQRRGEAAVGLDQVEPRGQRLQGRDLRRSLPEVVGEQGFDVAPQAAADAAQLRVVVEDDRPARASRTVS